MSLSKLMGATSEEGPAKRGRRKEARPGELLDAALDLFVEKGFAATRAEEVAARAGVSKGTLFLYFPSKEDLFKAVVRENMAGRFAEWKLELDAFEGNSAELLRQCYAVWWERIGSTKASGITKLMVGEARNFPALAQFYQQEVLQPGTVWRLSADDGRSEEGRCCMLMTDGLLNIARAFAGVNPRKSRTTASAGKPCRLTGSCRASPL